MPDVAKYRTAWFDAEREYHNAVLAFLTGASWGSIKEVQRLRKVADARFAAYLKERGP